MVYDSLRQPGKQWLLIGGGSFEATEIIIFIDAQSEIKHQNEGNFKPENGAKNEKKDRISREDLYVCRRHYIICLEPPKTIFQRVHV